MTADRRMQLIRAEELRHRALALADAPRRHEHLEVAEALEYAAKYLSGEGKPCKLEINLHSGRRRSATSDRGSCRAKRRRRGS